MNNIEKLAIEHGSTCYTGQEYHFERWQLEAFAKALQQSSEPVAVEKVEALLNKHKASIFKTIDVIPVSDGDVLITQDQLLNLISEYTHPPASVPLEKYNKLLDALKDLFADYKALVDSGNAGFWELEETEIGKRTLQAIAEAEGKE